MRLAPLSLVVALTGCASGPLVIWDRLADDETVWARCQRSIAAHACGPMTAATNLHTRAVCVLRLTNEYRTQATYAAQRGWLVAHRCPLPLVSPEQVTFDLYETEPFNRPSEVDPGPVFPTPLAPPAPPPPREGAPTAPPTAPTPPAPAQPATAATTAGGPEPPNPPRP